MKLPLIHGKRCAVCLLCMGLCIVSGSGAFAQDNDGELQIDDEYRIIGRDTRVFQLEGDRLSTVHFIPQALPLPEEERDIESSEGLISEDERLFRKASFGSEKGSFAAVDLGVGKLTPFDGWLKASVDTGKLKGTVTLDDRHARENTPANDAPQSQDIEVTGYGTVAGIASSAAFRFTREDEDVLGGMLRFNNRSVSGFGGGLSARAGLGKNWDSVARVSFDTVGYKDTVIKKDENDVSFAGDARLTGDFWKSTIRFDARYDYSKFGSDSGSIVRAGGIALFNPFTGLGIGVGATFYGSAAPDGDGLDADVYPNMTVDWAFSRTLYVRARYNPGIVRRSVSDIYEENGLYDFNQPMVFEKRTLNTEGEIGWRFAETSSASVGVFRVSTENALIFKPMAGNSVFTVIPEMEATISGVRAKVSFQPVERWGVDGLAVFRDTTCDSLTTAGAVSGDVPFMPSFEARADGFFRLAGKLRLTGTARFHGKYNYYDDRLPGSKTSESGFLTVDCGIEYPVFKVMTAWFIIRNLTDSAGSWWTADYDIPGVGFYGGIRTTLAAE